MRACVAIQDLRGRSSKGGPERAAGPQKKLYIANVKRLASRIVAQRNFPCLVYQSTSAKSPRLEQGTAHHRVCSLVRLPTKHCAHGQPRNVHTCAHAQHVRSNTRTEARVRATREARNTQLSTQFSSGQMSDGETNSASNARNVLPFVADARQRPRTYVNTQLRSRWVSRATKPTSVQICQRENRPPADIKEHHMHREEEEQKGLLWGQHASTQRYCPFEHDTMESTKEQAS